MDSGRGDSGGHYGDGTRYATDQIDVFAVHSNKHGTVGEAFVDFAIAQSLKELVYGKRFLDIGCGVGYWCYTAAQYGAKTVDGFDIQEEMVKQAKKATSELDNVYIQVGSVTNMPYSESSFDIATSFFVTCNLSLRAFEKQFQELYRVLVPGGKVIMLTPTDSCSSRLYTKMGADPTTVEAKITQILKTLPKYPTTAQITEAFKDDIGLYVAIFAVDAEGNAFRVKNINQLTNGQPIWAYTDVMMFPNFFYSDQSIITNILEAGFHIDSIQNYFTEDRRVAHNSKGPRLPVIEKCVKEPLALVYYLSKSNIDEPPY